jgi:hypothetical protein
MSTPSHGGVQPHAFVPNELNSLCSVCAYPSDGHIHQCRSVSPLGTACRGPFDHQLSHNDGSDLCWTDDEIAAARKQQAHARAITDAALSVQVEIRHLTEEDQIKAVNVALELARPPRVVVVRGELKDLRDAELQLLARADDPRPPAAPPSADKDLLEEFWREGEKVREMRERAASQRPQIKRQVDFEAFKEAAATVHADAEAEMRRRLLPVMGDALATILARWSECTAGGPLGKFLDGLEAPLEQILDVLPPPVASSPIGRVPAEVIRDRIEAWQAWQSRVELLSERVTKLEARAERPDTGPQHNHTSSGSFPATCSACARLASPGSPMIEWKSATLTVNSKTAPRVVSGFPRTPCVSCDPRRPCFAGWNECDLPREASAPIAHDVADYRAWQADMVLRPARTRVPYHPGWRKTVERQGEARAEQSVPQSVRDALDAAKRDEAQALATLPCPECGQPHAGGEFEIGDDVQLVKDWHRKGTATEHGEVIAPGVYGRIVGAGGRQYMIMVGARGRRIDVYPCMIRKPASVEDMLRGEHHPRVAAVPIAEQWSSAPLSAEESDAAHALGVRRLHLPAQRAEARRRIAMRERAGARMRAWDPTPPMKLIAADLTHGDLDDIREQVAGYSSDSVWRKLLAAFDRERDERARTSRYNDEIAVALDAEREKVVRLQSDVREWCDRAEDARNERDKVKAALAERAHEQPTFNHARADGPFDPCPQCLDRMSRPALIALVKDLRACARLERGCEVCGADVTPAPSFCDEHRSFELTGAKLVDARLRVRAAIVAEGWTFEDGGDEVSAIDAIIAAVIHPPAAKPSGRPVTHFSGIDAPGSLVSDIRKRVTKLTLARGLPHPVWSELCRLDSMLSMVMKQLRALGAKVEFVAEPPVGPAPSFEVTAPDRCRYQCPHGNRCMLHVGHGDSEQHRVRDGAHRYGCPFGVCTVDSMRVRHREGCNDPACRACGDGTAIAEVTAQEVDRVGILHMEMTASDFPAKGDPVGRMPQAERVEDAELRRLRYGVTPAAKGEPVGELTENDLPENTKLSDLGPDDAAFHAAIAGKRVPAQFTKAPTNPLAAPAALATAREWAAQHACKVCQAEPNSEGVIEHGKGCYVVNEDGGGTSTVPIGGGPDGPKDPSDPESDIPF